MQGLYFKVTHGSLPCYYTMWMSMPAALRGDGRASPSLPSSQPRPRSGAASSSRPLVSSPLAQQVHAPLVAEDAKEGEEAVAEAQPPAPPANNPALGPRRSSFMIESDEEEDDDDDDGVEFST